MTYEQALDYWFGRINYERSAPQPGDFKLDRMRELLQRLDNPHERFGIVHIAGSKGKGSTSAMLAGILGAAGYRTGLFTSPHLCRVEERIQVNRLSIASEELTALMSDIRQAVEGPGREALTPTFFEIATALGFLHFARQGVDLAVIEVGLGGRFDSTNVCRPLVAAITSISFDHTELLGDRLASIAMEKAGIVKPGRPAVSGAAVPEARQVIEVICRERGAPLQQLEVDFHYRYEPGQIVPRLVGTGHVLHKPRVHVTTARRAWPALEVGLLGEHQAANAAVAVACVEQLRDQGLAIPDEAVRVGLAEVDWPARLEVLGGRPLVVLDCAHNLASAHALIETLTASLPATRRWLIFAGSHDKDLVGMLRMLAPHFAHAYLTRYSTNPRSVPPERLAEILERDTQLPYTLCSDSVAAWQSACAAAGPDELICVTGSVFLAGELRPVIVEATST
jgi:dihydrofolate synthase/folylpolyglutamate synthase